MTSMQDAQRRRRVVVGVDTHKHIHVAVALDELGGRIEARSFAADRSGYEQLIDWATSLGREVIFGDSPDPQKPRSSYWDGRSVCP